MFCGFSRLLVVLCVLVGLFLGPVSPARAYVCAPSAAPTRVAAQKTCEPSRAPLWRKRGDADAMSFVFFMGAVVAVLLIPVALGRREELPPE